MGHQDLWLQFYGLRLQIIQAYTSHIVPGKTTTVAQFYIFVRVVLKWLKVMFVKTKNTINFKIFTYYFHLEYKQKITKKGSPPLR